MIVEISRQPDGDLIIRPAFPGDSFENYPDIRIINGRLYGIWGESIKQRELFAIDMDDYQIIERYNDRIILRQYK